MADKIICRGLSYECQIGFHDCEKGQRQVLVMDIEADVAPIPTEHADDPHFLIFDYFKTNKVLKTYFKEHGFKLLESVAENVAQLLMREFSIQAVRVTVTKRPQNIPNMESVSYQCYRQKDQAE